MAQIIAGGTKPNSGGNVEVITQTQTTTWAQLQGKPYIAISSKGIFNGLSTIPNDGADFGPDTTLGATAPGEYGGTYTETSGVQEAYDYTPAGGEIYLVPNGIYTLNTSVLVSKQIKIRSGMSYVFQGGIPAPSYAYIQTNGNFQAFIVSTYSFEISNIVFVGTNSLSNTNDIPIDLYVPSSYALGAKIENCTFYNNYIGVRHDVSLTNPITGEAQSTNGTNIYYLSNIYSCLYANKYMSNNNGSSHSVQEKFFGITTSTGYGLYLQENVSHYLEGSIFINPSAAALYTNPNALSSFDNYYIASYQNQTTPNPVVIVANQSGTAIINFSNSIIKNGSGGTTTIQLNSDVYTLNITNTSLTKPNLSLNGYSISYLTVPESVKEILLAPTTPSVPASGTAQQNTNPYPVDVYVYGGTVTEIQITKNGTAYTVFSNSTGLALSGQAYKLNPGDSITVTYTTAPTWEWLSD